MLMSQLKVILLTWDTPDIETDNNRQMFFMLWQVYIVYMNKTSYSWIMYK